MKEASFIARGIGQLITDSIPVKAEHKKIWLHAQHEYCEFFYSTDKEQTWNPLEVDNFTFFEAGKEMQFKVHLPHQESILYDFKYDLYEHIE